MIWGLAAQENLLQTYDLDKDFQIMARKSIHQLKMYKGEIFLEKIYMCVCVCIQHISIYTCMCYVCVYII